MLKLIVSKAQISTVFNLSKTIEIELPHKTVKVIVPKVGRQNFLLHFFFIQNAYFLRIFVKSHDIVKRRGLQYISIYEEDSL